MASQFCDCGDRFSSGLLTCNRQHSVVEVTRRCACTLSSLYLGHQSLEVGGERFHLRERLGGLRGEGVGWSGDGEGAQCGHGPD